MALQSSGQIKMTDVSGEFGGIAPHTLKEYYGVASGVPSSGEISLKDFYGTSSVIVQAATDGQTNQNLSTVFGSAWGQSTNKEYQVGSGVEIGGIGASNNQAAIYVPSGLGGNLTIVVTGTVTGHGGDGGGEGEGMPGGAFGGGGVQMAGGDGTNGGHAIFLESNGVTVQVKTGGTLRAGGGGGGGGGGGQKKPAGVGGSRSGGDGGVGGNGAGYQQSQQNGGGDHGGQSGGFEGGDGGNGGDFGQAGQDGQFGGARFSSQQAAGGEGGSAGTARLHASGISSTLDNEGGTVQG